MKKLGLFALAGGSILLSGCWGTLHNVFIHASDLTQFWAALDQLGQV
jgi:outer membrane murein-binding lipoprotein Lpp